MDFDVNGTKAEYKDFSDIENEIREITKSQDRSIVVLGDLDESFVQIAYENGVFLVEKKDVLTKSIYRAYNLLIKGEIGFQAVNLGGERYLLEADEVMEVGDVIAIFKSFYNGQNMPSYIDWRFFIQTLD